MYDYAHPISDALEKITHSLCTLEFEVHRPLYDWTIKELGLFPSRQIEFARLNLNYTVMSKRKLMELVKNKTVSGWDDPRMPTISGLRRRGYTPQSLREFTHRIGIAKRENVIDVSLLEFCVREDLNVNAPRMMAVLNPLKVHITNWDATKTEFVSVENNPEKPETGHREIPFCGELWIEADDFMENPPKKYFRLSPGGIVRLKGAYIIRCQNVVKDAAGKIVRLDCEYIPESRSGHDTSGLHPKGVLHWVSARHAVAAECRVYDRLFKTESPDDGSGNFMEHLNANSLTVLPTIYCEPALRNAVIGSTFQFLRNGYFCTDKDSDAKRLVFNRTVTLKDSWKPAR
jgi:glutaminyl-tRNA synthetase